MSNPHQAESKKLKLTPMLVQRGSQPGKYYDDSRNGLFLIIRRDGSKYFSQRIVINGKRREIGLGKPPEISLAEARIKARENRKKVLEGIDIITERNRAKMKTRFEPLARDRHRDLSTGFHSGPHGEKRIRSLELYVFPKIGEMDVTQINALDVKDVLMQNIDGEPLWQKHAETAKRVKQRISDVFDVVVALGLRTDNPGKSVDALLPNQKKKSRNMPSIPYDEVADAIVTIKGSNCMLSTALCFEWMILTATRPGEARGAIWGEIDRDSKVWKIPEERMKTKVDHVVPLSTRCMEILDEAESLWDGTHEALLFPNDIGKPISDVTMVKLLRENKIDAVPHGFRASFRTWTQNETDCPRELAESALAHKINNKSEAAYARGDYLNRRRSLMQDWADYLEGEYKRNAST